MLTKRDSRPEIASDVPEVEAFVDGLRPGDAIDLILNPDVQQTLDIRRASLLEIDRCRGLVVSQPTQKLTKTAAAQRLEATVVKHDRQTNMYTRLGFYTTISSFIGTYELADGTQEALLLAPPREVHPADLRASFRLSIPPSLLPPVTLINESQQTLGLDVELMNLASGGALVSYHQPSGTHPLMIAGESICLELDFSELIERLAVRLHLFQTDAARLQIRGRVTRIHEETENERCYAAVSFVDLTRPQEDLLHAIIHKLQLFISSPGAM